MAMSCSCQRKEENGPGDSISSSSPGYPQLGAIVYTHVDSSMSICTYMGMGASVLVLMCVGIDSIHVYRYIDVGM